MERQILSEPTAKQRSTAWSNMSFGLLAGYDVNGFSEIVDNQVQRVGRIAGEVSASALLKGARAFSATMSEIGLLPVESIGDGILYLASNTQPLSPAQLDKHLTLACRRHLETAGLSVRAAWAQADIYSLDLEGLIGNQSTLLLGPAVAQLHHSLASAPRARHPMRNGSSAADKKQAPNDWVDDVDGSISNEYCAFVRLYEADEWPRATADELWIGLNLVSKWASAMGGRIERVAHDEKGIQIRLYFPTHGANQFGLQPGLETLVSTLSEQGFSSAASLGLGLVFRGFQDETWQVHGSVINHAAKRCARLKTGKVDGNGQPESHTEPIVSQRDTLSKPVGRDEEFARITAHLGGSGARCVSVRGEAGLGKTVLARHIFDIDQSGVSSAWFRCSAQTLLKPFAVIRALLPILMASVGNACAEPHQVVRRALEAAAIPAAWHEDCRQFGMGREAVAPINSDTDPTFRPHYLGRFALALFDQLSLIRPIYMGVDDAHLIDQLSADLFAELLTTRSRVSIILTSRPIWLRDPLRVIESSEATLEQLLEPLNAEAIANIVTSTCPTVQKDEVKAILDVANGNPFIASQMAHSISAGIKSQTLSIDHLIADRVAALSPDVRMVLRVVSLAGSALEARDIERSVARLATPCDVEAAVSLLKTNNLVQERFKQAEMLEPAHDLIGTAVKAEMSQGSSILIHRSLARTLWTAMNCLQRSRSHLPDLALHWIGAHAFGRGAICLAWSAREALDNGYMATAAALYSRAIQAADEAGFGNRRRVADWHSRHSEALWSMGELKPANAAARRSLALVKSSKRTPRVQNIILRAANMRSETGYFTGSLSDLFGGSLTMFRISSGGLQQSLAQGRGFGTLAYMSGMARLTWLSDQMFKTAKASGQKKGDKRSEAFLLTAEGLLHMTFCRWAESALALQSGMACLDQLPTEHQLIEVMLTSQGHLAAFQGQFGTAIGKFEDLRQRAVRRSHPLHHGWSLYMLALLKLRDRDLTGADMALTEAELLLQDLGDQKSLHIMKGIRAQLLWLQGDYDRALHWASLAGEDSRINKPTNFSSLEGYAAAPMIGALAVIQESGLRERGLRLINDHLGSLKSYARIFPIGRPRLATIDALITKGPHAAVMSAAMKRALWLAETTGMKGEYALAAQVFGNS
jgi:AAA ATPase domain